MGKRFISLRRAGLRAAIAAMVLSILAFRAPELMAAGGNRIEQAGTPVAFSTITIVNRPGAGPLNLHGEFILGTQSNGLNFAADRLVVIVGSDIAVLPPNTLRPSGNSDKVWAFQNDAAPVLTKLILQKKSETAWQFEIGTRGTAAKLYMRIGNDWGGIDLNNGQALLTLQPSLDTAHRAQSTIGAAGGYVQTMASSGAFIRLNVPAKALAQNTLITITPLQASPVLAATRQANVGIQFEPDGLRFAIPATLTYDFSPLQGDLDPKTSLFLVTSPMTMVPLHTTVNPAKKTLTASIYHFSSNQPAIGNAALTDIAWAQSVLTSSQVLTEEEIESLLAAVATQQQLGCTADCIDLSLVTQKVDDSVTSIVLNNCPLDTAAPSISALQGYLRLDTLVQQVGGSVPNIRSCERGILSALITQASAVPADPPSNLADFDIQSEPTLLNLTLLATTAQQLGFNDLQTQALQKLDQALRTLAQKLVDAIRRHEGTPDEDSAKQAGTSDLQQEAQYGSANGVGSVDSGFGAFIQQEIDSLQSLKFALGVDSFFIGTTTRVCSREAFFSPNPWIYSTVPSPPLPYSFSSSDCAGATINQTVKRSGTSAVEFDLDLNLMPGQGGQGIAVVVATLPRAGRLEYDLNTDWATNATGPFRADAPMDGIVAWVGGPDVPAYVYNFTQHKFTEGTNFVNVGAGTHLIYFIWNSNNTAPNAGQGRLATVTFR